jgi:hypothetical protein
MTNRSILCLVMQGIGVYVAIQAIQSLTGLVVPLLDFDGFAGSSRSSWMMIILLQTVIHFVIAWLLLFKNQTIAKILVKEVQGVAGNELAHRAAISQLWFWIALIGIYQLIAPMSYLIQYFIGPSRGYIQQPDYSAGGLLVSSSTGPHVVMILVALALIVFCKPIGRLIQGSDRTDQGTIAK